MLQEAEEDHNYPNLSLVPAGFLRLLFGFYSPARGGNAIPTTHGARGALGNANAMGPGSCDRWGPGRGRGKGRSPPLSWAKMKRQRVLGAADLFPHQKKKYIKNALSALACPKEEPKAIPICTTKSSETPSSLFNFPPVAGASICKVHSLASCC